MDDARGIVVLENLEQLRPSVGLERSPRVLGRLRGSLDQAVPLISITIRATWSPRVISQSQPRASTAVSACLPRFALISQLTKRDSKCPRQAFRKRTDRSDESQFRSAASVGTCARRTAAAAT